MTYTKPFLRVWAKLPKGMKKGKFQAQKTWTKIYAELPDEDVLIKAVQNQQAERALLKRQNKFCPEWKYFSTWLNAGCWDDECELALRVVKAVRNTPGNGVDNMKRAYNILSNIDDPGSDVKFREFCKGVNMSAEDIDCVIFKHTGQYSREKAVIMSRGIG